jgi:hypothetical protein
MKRQKLVWFGPFPSQQSSALVLEFTGKTRRELMDRREPTVSADAASSDGFVGIDAVWKRRLTCAISETPLEQSLLDALRPLVGLLEGIDMADLEAVIEDKRAEWRNELYSDGGSYQLPRTYLLDFAIAIHLYTLSDPAVHKVINRAMFNPQRRGAAAAAAAAAAVGGAGRVSAELTACLPFIKFLDAALEALPAAYVFKGRVCRGVQWCYPSPARHDPEGYFATGKMVMWYEFKSTSTSMEVMTRDHFCGMRPGPRTIFTIDACRAYSIEKFSIFQGMEKEYEVLFRPLSQFRVVHATKMIIDAAERSSLERSGFPDNVSLVQIDEAPTPPLLPAVSAMAPPPVPAQPPPRMPSNQEQTASPPPPSKLENYTRKVSKVQFQFEPSLIETLVARARGGADFQKEQAARELASLALDAGNQVAIAQAGGIAPLVTLARSGTDGQKVQAALALAFLANNVENQVAIAQAGGIAPLVELAQRGTDGQKVQAARALRNLSFNDGNATLIARVRSDLEVAIAQEGGITLLVSLAQRGTDGQKEQAARALGNLAVQNAENKVAIAQAGGIELLVTLVERGTDGQKEQAAGALKNLATDAGSHVAIAQAGGIVPLVTLVQSGTDGQKEQGAGALWNLSFNAENQIAIAQAGGIATLVTLVQSGTDGQKEHAAGALWNCYWNLSHNDENKVAITQAGGIVPLVECVCRLWVRRLSLGVPRQCVPEPWK